MMAQHLNDELEYMVEDYFDMAEFDDEEVGNIRRQSAEGSDLEGEMDMSKQKTDTSAYEFRNGKDMQGIPWERLNYSRDKYREMRLRQYKNYENLSRSREALEKECKKIKMDSMFYDFQFNTRLVKSTIVHFQALKAERNYLLCSCWIGGHLQYAEESPMGHVKA